MNNRQNKRPETSRRDKIVQTIGTTLEWLFRIIGVYTFFTGVLVAYIGLLPPAALLVPFALYALGSWLVEGERLFTIRWR